MVKRKNLFGGQQRCKLFSVPPRKKLFSGGPVEYNEGGVTLRQVVCRDCGHVLETSESTSSIVCPNCGGTRFNIRIKPYSEPQTPEPVPEKGDDNEYLTKVKEFSGKTLEAGEYEKVFPESEREALAEKGFSMVGSNGEVTISGDTYQMEKTFSKLIIQVTKVLDLDEDIMSGVVKKEDVIDKLEESHALPEKGILVLKKAHNLPIGPQEGEHLFCDSGEENWLEDSGIVSDLAVEYANDSFGIKQFMDILNNRYPDAPEDIIDLLIKAGAIRIDGSQVTVNK